MRKYIFFFMVTMIFSALNLVYAQDNKPVQMADAMRSNGKIFVVVAVIVILFAGLVLYLVSLDKKITKLERETNNG